MFHIQNRILTSTSSPLLFPEYIMKVERIFDNTIGYSFLAEVSCESLFKIIWYIKSNGVLRNRYISYSFFASVCTYSYNTDSRTSDS